MRAKRARSTITKIIWLTIHPRNFGYDVSVRPSVQTFRVVESSPHGLLGYGKVEIFWREIAWRNGAQLVLKKEISMQLSKKIFRQSLYNFLLQLTKAIMSTNNSREILACRRQVLSREQREGERQRARVNTRRASEDDRQRERVRSRRRRQNFSEESRQVERVRARRRRENYSEKRRQAERDRARMNRQRQREREIQRQRERQQNNDMMTESVVLMSLWPRAIDILISN